MVDYIVFGDFNTKENGWKLLDLVENPPAPKVNKFDIPYTDGSVVASGYTPGTAHPLFYENRTVTYVFAKEDINRDWEHVFDDFMLAVHGRHLIVYHGQKLLGRPYRVGDCAITEMAVSGTVATITVVLDAYPFKIYPETMLYNGPTTHDAGSNVYRIPTLLTVPSVRDTSIEVMISGQASGDVTMYFGSIYGNVTLVPQYSNFVPLSRNIDDICGEGPCEVRIVSSRYDLTGKNVRIRFSGKVL